MTDPDPAQTYERLRAETAEMLKLDAANLSLVEGLQLDLVSLLRLEVDGLQGAVLAGEQVDLARLSTALAMLQKLLPTQLAPAAAAERDDFAGAREELRQLFARRFEALSRRRVREEIELAADPAKARAKAHAEFEERLAAALEKHGGNTIPNPGSGVAQSDEGCPHPPLAAPDAPAARCGSASEHPALIDPPEVCPTAGQTPPPPPPRKTLDEINATPVPAHYLKQDSPWRQHLDADGNIVAPYFRGGYG
jgi:hypothetical protein